MLVKLSTIEDFNYHPQCDQLKITHLEFADDLMLFSRGGEGSIRILMDCMKEFGEVTGLKLNVAKSNIYLAGVGGTNHGVLSMPLDSLGGTTHFDI